MRKAGYVLLGAFVASISIFFWMKNVGTGQRARIEEYLKLGDDELLTHSSEIQQLDGLEGKIMLALLACVGLRGHSAEALPTPIPEVKRPARPPEVAPSGPTGPSALSPAPAASSNATPFFCKKVHGKPNRAEELNWDKVFPFDNGTQPTTSDFGVLDNEYDANAVLEARICENPSLWQVTAARRDESAFFRQIHGKIFEGQLQLLDPHSRQNIRVHFHSNPNARDIDREYLSIYRGSGLTPEELLENRYFSYAKTHAAWRYNPCFRSVALVNDYCPWGDLYDREYKDLFYVSSSRELIGNIYCRKRADHSWARMGKFALRQTASEQHRDN
ncbi:MAG: hypothetical protein HY074_03485 [Deltaproteobacteria bacterium]|nr:hypothetical protein [Deltaproteobacteria bacterium]